MRHIKKFESFGIETVEEGVAFKSSKTIDKKTEFRPDRKEDFRKKISDHIKSQGLSTKKIGDDFEIMSKGEMVGQVMFRDKDISVKKAGSKFSDKFDYTELGKIKSTITGIIKNSK